MNYKYKILNFWNDQDDLYVNYEVENLETNDIANVIDHYNTSDIGCDYNRESEKVIENCLYNLIEKNNGLEFNMPKVSEVSPLLKYVYDSVCESFTNMCHIDNFDWEEMKDEFDFTDGDIDILKEEIKKYNLDDLITIDCDGYKICGYGLLQTMFNDDRVKESDELER